MLVPRRDDGRANETVETAPRTVVREPEAAARIASPGPLPRGPALCRLSAQHCWVEGFSCLPEAECDHRDLAGQREACHVGMHASLEEAVVEVAERTRPADGCDGVALKTLLTLRL
jgi:hypothetical protein